MPHAVRTTFLLLALCATAKAQAPEAPRPAPVPPAAPAPAPGAKPLTAPSTPAPPATATPSPAGAPEPGAAPGEAAPPRAQGPYEAGSPGQSEPPPPAYYVEPPTTEGIVEPPAPGGPYPSRIWEPPPPPEPRRVAPKTALWLGARLGWFVPFGSVYARALEARPFFVQEGVPMRDYLGPGPVVELDIGGRFSRNYMVFALWERGELSAGDGDGGWLGDHGQFEGGDTDFWAIGLRASSDADSIGFASELALGYRRARAEWEDGTTLEMTEGMFEARVGLGADIRINPKFTLSPMVTFGVGMFGDVDLVAPDGTAVNLISPVDDTDGHGWFTIHMGAHFDLTGQD